MTYPIGSILLIKKYKLPTVEKDKFFIVLDQEGSDYNLLSITTSKFDFSDRLIKHGIINQHSYASVFCFEKDKIIGENGFYFWKNTFISLNNNINKFSFEVLSQYNIEVKDKLITSELQNLIYCFYRFRGTPKKWKLKLEDILNKI